MRKIIFLLVLSGLIYLGCSESEETVNLKGKLIYQSDCLSSKSEYTENNESCIEYNYDSAKKVLTLNHKNAGFNCCPGKISCSFEFKKNVIVITENEETAGCNCNCLYDLTIEISDIESGIFNIIFVESYVGDQQMLEFNIDLSVNQHGEFCVTRNSYPWGTK